MDIECAASERPSDISMKHEALLEVRSLRKYFPARRGILSRARWVHAVDGASFIVEAGETFGLVGESGCGKTTVLRLIMRLIEPTSGEAIFTGEDIFKMSRERLKWLRSQISMIFQDPHSSLDPRMTLADIIAEPLKMRGLRKAKQRMKRVQELLERVGLSKAYVNRYPHEFSGGQKQRIGIARALAVGPKLILADEPVSSLDLSIRGSILNLLRELQGELGLAYLYVSHDLSTVRHFCHRTMVMYLGKGVELGPTDDVYLEPLHPYTKVLMSAIPVPDPAAKVTRKSLKGEVPSSLNPPSGCYFHPRCPYAIPTCSEKEPDFVEVKQGRYVACHLVQ